MGVFHIASCISSDFLGDIGFVSFALDPFLFVLTVGSYRAVNHPFHGGAWFGHLCLGFFVQVFMSTEIVISVFFPN